jgi:hypothetical protein
MFDDELTGFTSAFCRSPFCGTAGAMGIGMLGWSTGLIEVFNLSARYAMNLSAIEVISISTGSS